MILRHLRVLCLALVAWIALAASAVIAPIRSTPSLATR
jgi:hypothetical protein